MGRSARSLRQRIRNQITVVVVIALLLFALPLAVALNALLTSRTLTGLQRDATRASAQVPDNLIQADTALPAPVGHGSVVIGIYTLAGTRVSGRGPAHSELAARTRDAREHDGRDGPDQAVALPVLSDGSVVGSVRAAQPRRILQHRVWAAWGLLAALAALVFAIALALARRAATRLARPFEDITRTAQDLGEGQAALPPPPTGIVEADAASTALHVNAHQLAERLNGERDFVRHASHQLRTPLSALLLHLQQQPPDVPAALERAQHLDSTIEDLLALRRPSSTQRCSPAQTATLAAQRWRAETTSIDLRLDDTPDVAMSGAALRQCLDVLIHNAVHHGEGPVIITVEAYGDTVAVEVADHGAGFASTSSYGTGLTLVASLAHRAGGDLLIRHRAPRPRVALVLPAVAVQESSKR